MGQRLHLHGGGHLTALHRIGFHEFHSGGGVVEQIPDDDGGAVGTAGLLVLHDLTGLQHQADTGDAACGFGHQIDAAHRSDGGQSFAAEAHSGDGGQILGGTQLGGCVAEEGSACVLAGHAAAVVRHPQVGHATVFDLHGDLGGTGIHGVFQQFLDHGSGTLHHLAGGN